MKTKSAIKRIIANPCENLSELKIISMNGILKINE
jgi:hypothetical protein